MLNSIFSVNSGVKNGHFDFFKDVIFIALIYKICDFAWIVCFVLAHLRTDIIHKPIWNAKVHLLHLNKYLPSLPIYMFF